MTEIEVIDAILLTIDTDKHNDPVLIRAKKKAAERRQKQENESQAYWDWINLKEKIKVIEQDYPQFLENLRERCEALITAMVGKDNTELWWNTPNKAFNNSTPEEMYRLSPNIVYDYLMKQA